MTRNYAPISYQEATKRYAEGLPIAAAKTRGWFSLGTDVPASMFFTQASLGGMDARDALPDPRRGGCFVKLSPAVELLVLLRAALVAAGDAPAPVRGGDGVTRDAPGVDAFLEALEVAGGGEVATARGHWFSVTLDVDEPEDVIVDWDPALDAIIRPIVEEVAS